MSNPRQKALRNRLGRVDSPRNKCSIAKGEIDPKLFYTQLPMNSQTGFPSLEGMPSCVPHDPARDLRFAARPQAVPETV
jgi:hypothetical protein